MLLISPSGAFSLLTAAPLSVGGRLLNGLRNGGMLYYLLIESSDAPMSMQSMFCRVDALLY